MRQHKRRFAAVAGVLALAVLAGAGEAGAATHHKHARHHRHHHHAVKASASRSHAKASTKPKVSPAAVENHVAFGAFAAGFRGTGLQITQLEKQLGAHLAIASSFQGSADVFPDAVERAQAASGHTLLVSWELGQSAGDRFTTFTDGSHDAYLAQVARAVASFGKPIFIRPWAEMNADWTAFQPTADGDRLAGGTPDEFIAAWRYVVTYFRDHGATNARWVFNPTADTYTETTDVGSIFPGAAYVDVLGLDGYNWGDGGVLRWRPFAAIYREQYQRLLAVDPGAPVWVCEVASKEPAEDDGAPVDPSHSKASWYRQLLESTDFPAISALVLFDVDKERDWRVGSDPQALAVMSAAAKAAV